MDPSAAGCGVVQPSIVRVVRGGSRSAPRLPPRHVDRLGKGADRTQIGNSRDEMAEVLLLCGRAVSLHETEQLGAPAAAESRATAWTAKELGRFLEHVAGERLFALWRLAATTGMRRGELLGLTWLALDVDGGTLRVDQQLVPTRGGVTFGPPKSKRSRRTIALDAGTVKALKKHREAQLLERSFADDAYADHDLVFADELGRPIYPQRLTEAFTRERKAAGLLSGTLHTLRHSHASLALTNGVPLYVMAARLGDRPETVLRTYAHLLPQSDVEAAEQVAALIA